MTRMMLIALVCAAMGQDSLTLRQAIDQALLANPALQASAAAQDETAAGLQQARSGALPKVNYSESWTRSDNPVFVFSSLLTQRRFEQSNFSLPALNRPDALNNFHSSVSVDQPIYDAGQTKRAVRMAELAKTGSAEAARGTRMAVIAQVARAYYGALLADGHLRVTAQAMRSAEADLERATARRDSGMATDADVLSIRVHLAQIREEQIQRNADLDVARATLNAAMGKPLDTQASLATPLTELPQLREELARMEQAGVESRPEVRQAGLVRDLAATRLEEARSGYLPRVSARGAVEAARGRFATQGGANWLVSIGLKWNLFNGFEDKARIAAGVAAGRRAEAERTNAETAVRLEIRRAWAGLRAAQQRMETARATVEEARESLRISQNRYEAGLATVSDLLRTETALLATETRQLAAVHDQRVAGLLLQLATGNLSADSEVFQ